MSAHCMSKCTVCLRYNVPYGRARLTSWEARRWRVTKRAARTNGFSRCGSNVPPCNNVRHISTRAGDLSEPCLCINNINPVYNSWPGGLHTTYLYQSINKYNVNIQCFTERNNLFGKNYLTFQYLRRNFLIFFHRLSLPFHQYFKAKIWEIGSSVLDFQQDYGTLINFYLYRRQKDRLSSLYTWFRLRVFLTSQFFKQLKVTPITLR